MVHIYSPCDKNTFINPFLSTVFVKCLLFESSYFHVHATMSIEEVGLNLAFKINVFFINIFYGLIFTSDIAFALLFRNTNMISMKFVLL